ncbi:MULTISPECIES: NUDIX hydrolase [unclassified Ruegeria]|uniref:NUDIX hydrolase n=1 Tax=unclassified Ruegeria TaxID=2625375 RepID=UPI001489B679|nr:MULTISPECIES: NUDIX hydrolase [unclassified Ruegeria]NOD46876.1 NUDIX domain-containing protein [Ruegeria sp. HKCCD5849]NOD51199.1 NUDIX domain-containing protein [Ruegeria sp. HKCCD5851]NOD68018.1 NUDIX domain-containing protein [Ruegeria sp. HKCCD7303]NOE33558.1 NUDIX domain-containing protein [Ruegeria sp. HKCCD7318]
MKPRLLRVEHLKSAEQPVLQQAAALCYRIKGNRPEVLLITTRRAQRWIIPKGWLIPGLSRADTALQEAWEEAGVAGQSFGEQVGQFLHHKHRLNRPPVPILVDVFPVLVRSVSQDFPEQGMRKRKWYPLKKAALKVHSPGLAELLRDFKPCTH